MKVDRRQKEIAKTLAVEPHTQIRDLATGKLLYTPPDGIIVRRVYLAC